MASGSLTTTSYAVLGLLAVQPWSAYDLTRQMDRSLAHLWPRAASKLYEEPKKLVAHGLARVREERAGRRTRAVYSITPKGRRALAAWLREPGAGPVLECEQLLKVFFSDHGTRDDLLATIAAARAWADERCAVSAAIGAQYVAGTGPFPERTPQQLLTAGFLNRFYAGVREWAAWAEQVVAAWPDDPSAATVTPEALADVVALCAGERAAGADRTRAPRPGRRVAPERAGAGDDREEPPAAVPRAKSSP